MSLTGHEKIGRVERDIIIIIIIIKFFNKKLSNITVKRMEYRF